MNSVLEVKLSLNWQVSGFLKLMFIGVPWIYLIIYTFCLLFVQYEHQRRTYQALVTYFYIFCLYILSVRQFARDCYKTYAQITEEISFESLMKWAQAMWYLEGPAIVIKTRSSVFLMRTEELRNQLNYT